MRHVPLLCLLLMVAVAGPAPRTQNDTRPLVFFIQQDIRPDADRLLLNDGMQELMGRLPADLPVRIYLTTRNEYTRIHAGPAGQLVWPPTGFTLTVTSPATTPYRNLLSFLASEELAGHTVVFITNGRSEDLFRLVDTEGFIQGADSFSPSRYPPLHELVRHCKEHRIRLVGLLVTTGASPRLQPDLLRVVNDAFNYGVNGSGGWAYSNFSTFTSVFNSLLKKGRLQP
ncbi:MAG TPA: hypothetical protein PLY66_03260 [Acidobacteriota bacterium]|nr:hypothetical protein [Acidobacteriota bacterium]HQF88205.1 hypothetical protein [Acidobacteriota bacterium]HQG92343.1 hypothetical protein [Acidobacteriota bacterium]HQK86551.1 hypothetical protein [Acidobacteriota bacterium]